jgi:hypothetical protein
VRHARAGVRAPLPPAPRRPLPVSRPCSCIKIWSAPRTTPALRSLPPRHERLAHFASETISWQKRVSFVRCSFTVPASDRGGEEPSTLFSSDPYAGDAPTATLLDRRAPAVGTRASRERCGVNRRTAPNVSGKRDVGPRRRGHAHPRRSWNP